MSSSDIVPLTILQKVMKEIPADVTEVMLRMNSLEDRETAFQVFTFADLSWMDDLQSETQAIFYVSTLSLQLKPTPHLIYLNIWHMYGRRSVASHAISDAWAHCYRVLRRLACECDKLLACLP